MTTSARIRKFAAPTALTPAPCMCILTKRSVRPWSSTSAIARMQQGCHEPHRHNRVVSSSSTMSNAMSPGRQRMATYTPLAYNFQALRVLPFTGRCSTVDSAGNPTSPSRPHLAGAAHHVLEGGELLDADGPARACRRPVAMPISAPMPNSPPSVKRVEALCSRSRRIHLGEEVVAGRLVLRHDAVRVRRAVIVDVVNRLFHAVDDVHREDGIEIFGRPVLRVANRTRCRWSCEQFITSPRAFLPAFSSHRRPAPFACPRSLPVHQQRLDRVANGGARSLALNDNSFGHLQVGRVHVNVADAFQMCRRPELGLPHWPRAPPSPRRRAAR